MSKVYCDPPHGWQYGFPKVWDKDKHPDLNKWLVSSGYPQSVIDKLGDRFYCRFWDAGDEEDIE